MDILKGRYLSIIFVFCGILLAFSIFNLPESQVMLGANQSSLVLSGSIWWCVLTLRKIQNQGKWGTSALSLWYLFPVSGISLA